MSINVSEAIWTIICFFALLFVLKKFLFDPLIKFMDQRQAGIDAGLEKGREAQRKKEENAAALRESWKERSAEAKQLIAEGKAADEEERSRVLEAAHAQAARDIQDAHGRIQNEQERLRAQAQEQMPQLVDALTRHLVGGDPGSREEK